MKLGDKYAFPREEYQTATDRGQPGMTLRQYYTGLAMQGLCANSFVSENSVGPNWRESLATEAVLTADAILAELERSR